MLANSTLASWYSLFPLIIHSTDTGHCDLVKGLAKEIGVWEVDTLMNGPTSSFAGHASGLGGRFPLTLRPNGVGPSIGGVCRSSGPSLRTPSNEHTNRNVRAEDSKQLDVCFMSSPEVQLYPAVVPTSALERERSS